MKKREKDPKKVAAGRKGGKASGSNFKRNKKLASFAGKRSAWARNSGKLEDYPLEYEEIPVPKAVKRERRAKS